MNSFESHQSSVDRDQLLEWCSGSLNAAYFKDYAPNGLQVQGRKDIHRIMCAVTASRASIEAAIAHKADALLVHHGMFWKSEPVALTGWKQQRISLLLANEINLIAYHLPLDAHPQWGNNAALAQHLGWTIDSQWGEQQLVMQGRLPETLHTNELVAQLAQKLGRTPLALGPDKALRTLAWCTGGAQNFFQAAIDRQVDAYLTGEVSEAQYHLAQESGVVFIAAGHHATERYGVQRLAQEITQEFGVPNHFFDEPNPA